MEKKAIHKRKMYLQEMLENGNNQEALDREFVCFYRDALYHLLTYSEKNNLEYVKGYIESLLK